MGKNGPESNYGEEDESESKAAQPGHDENGVRSLDHLDEAALFEMLTGEKPASENDLATLKAGGEKEVEPEDNVPLGEKLKKYPSKPQRDLDLHGKKGEEAGRAVRLFLLESERLNLRKVRIITGKGLHSEEGQSVLKTVAETKIRELKDEGRILASEWDGKSRASSGAVIVYLV